MGSSAPEPSDRPVTPSSVPGAQPRSRSAGERPVKFRNPPVIETLLSVQFVPLPRLDLPYFGLFWSDIRSSYPHQEVKPPLAPVVEEFPLVPKAPTVGIQVSSEPDARFWFINESGTELIQIQRDRFIRNWRWADTGKHYPGYDELRPRFEHDWRMFVRFLDREHLGAPDVNQCEVTYVNHIELGMGWRSFGDPSPILSLVAPRPGRSTFLPDPEMLLVNATYAMPDQGGRVHVAAQPALRRSDGKEVLQVTLTARGRPRSSDLQDLVTWFNDGHEWIVNGFVDITTPTMQDEVWHRL